MIEVVEEGSNLTGKYSKVKATSYLTIEEIMPANVGSIDIGMSDADIDKHLSGDAQSNIHIFNALFPELSVAGSFVDPEVFDTVDIDISSLKNYIIWLKSDADKLAAHVKSQHLRQAGIILAVASCTNGKYYQRKKTSDFGRTYYTGISVQNVNKELRRAMLGNCWEYDIQSSVVAWKMTFATCCLQATDSTADFRKYYSSTLWYLDDKEDFMRTIRLSVFDSSSNVPLDLQTKLVKRALTAISFGARLSTNGWRTEDGTWSNPALVEIIQNNTERQRFVSNAMVKQFIYEQTALDSYIFNEVSENLPTMLADPIVHTTRGRPSKAKVIAYLYQHDETRVMDIVRRVAAEHGYKPLANIHDAVIFKKRLNGELKKDIVTKMRHETGNHYWRLNTKELKGYESRYLDATKDEELHRQRITAEEQRAARWVSEIRSSRK